MKKGFVYSVISLMMLVLMACGPSKAEKELQEKETLSKEVLAVHDEVMPKMDELMKLRKQLKDSVNAWTENNVAANSDKIKTAKEEINKLESADKAMMDWMHEYNGGEGLYDHTLVMEYLNVEKGKITAIQKQFEEALGSAKTYVSQF